MKLDELNLKILEGLSGKEKEDFERGLKLLNMANPADREALRESIRRARPDFIETQIDIFVEGEASKAEVSLKESFIRLGLTNKQAEIAAKGDVKNLGYSGPSGGGDREALIASLKCAHPDWTDRQIEIFLNPDRK